MAHSGTGEWGNGCERCRTWVNEVRNGELVSLGSFKDAFTHPGGYFSIDLYWCPACATTWIQGYHETADPGDFREFGDRTFMIQPLSVHQVQQIHQARQSGGERLDFFEFRAGDAAAPDEPLSFRDRLMRDLGWDEEGNQAMAEARHRAHPDQFPTVASGRYREVGEFGVVAQRSSFVVDFGLGYLVEVFPDGTVSEPVSREDFMRDQRLGLAEVTDVDAAERAIAIAEADERVLQLLTEIRERSERLKARLLAEAEERSREV